MLRIFLLLALACGAVSAGADDYPNRAIRLIVPFSPGGATDVPARLIAPKMSEALGQPVVVENKPGAGGIIGIDAVVKSPADGYTLLMATNGELVMNPWIYAKLPYDPFVDLTPIAVVVESPLFLLVASSSSFGSLGDIVSAAKAKPGSLAYATAGPGSTSHVLTEMLAQQAGIQLLHVPYKGGAPGAAAIVSGEVALGLLNVGSATSLLKSGRAKALAVTSAARHPGYPQVPTVSEAGVANFADGIWVGMAAPAGVPQDVIQRLNSAIGKALQSPDVIERLAKLGVHPVRTTPGMAADRIKQEAVRYRDAIRKAHIRVD